MSAFAWPLCVFACFLLFVLLFRKEIGGLLGKVRNVSKGGLVVGIGTQDTADANRPSKAEELLAVFDNRLLLEQENIIRGSLEAHNIQSAPERERVLVRYLASSYLIYRFEKVYQYIFGSQIRALQSVSESRLTGLPMVALDPWYQMGTVLEPDLYAHYNFDQWFAFMTGWSLLTVRDKMVHVTVFGNEFLKYLVDNGFDLGKRG